MPDAPDRAELRAALATVLELTLRADTRTELQSAADSLDRQIARDWDTRRIGEALDARAQAASYWITTKLDHQELGELVRQALYDVNGQITIGHEQSPADIIDQLTAERDRYQAWIANVAQRGTGYESKPVFVGPAEGRAERLAAHIRSMHDSIRKSARRVLEGDGVEIGDEQPAEDQTPSITDPPAEYYVVGRDAAGNIRTNRGNGVSVFNAGAGLADAWHAYATAVDEHTRRLFGATLDLLIAEAPVGELIGYRLVTRTDDGFAWRMTYDGKAIPTDLERIAPMHDARIAALYLLPEAVSGDE